jgi:hypothetical protein
VCLFIICDQGSYTISCSAIFPLHSSYKIQGTFILFTPTTTASEGKQQNLESLQQTTKMQAVFKFCSCTSWHHSLLSIEYLVPQIKCTVLWALILLQLAVQSQTFCSCFLGCNNSHNPTIKCQWQFSLIWTRISNFYFYTTLWESNGKLPLRICPEYSMPRAIQVAWLGSGSSQNRPKGWILINQYHIIYFV